MQTKKTESIDYDAIYHSSSFKTKTKKRATMTIVLLECAFISFFSFPFLNNVFPEVMKYRLAGAFNVGLAWAILQYPVMGLVAWIYAHQMQKLETGAQNKTSNVNKECNHG
ncbi:MAG: hypothetical protein XXXJIFNMEKO3_02298 [Candidatus Erwinia impunctatus]|nr:hypothetical protein XXXJIFNMEKO_02298 [Culicoides impunctatus]